MFWVISIVLVDVYFESGENLPTTNSYFPSLSTKAAVNPFPEDSWISFYCLKKGTSFGWYTHSWESGKL